MSRLQSQPPRVLADFEGAWRFERTVLHEGGDRAVVTGRVTFTADGDGLVYEEVGRISLNGKPPITATRRYLWRAGLDVLFEDGRPFHTVPPRGGIARHWCDPDSYTVSYDFAAWPAWTAEWQVTGPRKDYRMATRYTRADDAARSGSCDSLAPRPVS